MTGSDSDAAIRVLVLRERPEAGKMAFIVGVKRTFMIALRAVGGPAISLVVIANSA